MNKKWVIVFVILLVALFLMIFAYMNNPNEIGKSGEIVSFNVSSGHSDLSGVIDNIKTKPYYEGYDAATVKWMESLGNKQVFIGNDSIVIMNINDARKIPPTPDITDVYIYDHFTAEVIEKHALGGKYPTVYYVKNVKYTDQEIIGNGLA